MMENQDNGLFEIDIEDFRPEPKKGRGRWPGKNPNPENKPIDIPDSGTVSANINKLDDNSIGVLCINDIDFNEIGENQGKSGKDCPFNRNELIFLEKYLIEKMSMISAMKSAGYENVTDRTLSNWGIKITNKYQCNGCRYSVTK